MSLYFASSRESPEPALGAFAAGAAFENAVVGRADVKVCFVRLADLQSSECTQSGLFVQRTAVLSPSTTFSEEAERKVIYPSAAA